jgi:hypothetical protein
MPLSAQKIVFALQNSLVDARGGSIPVFLRGSPTTIERGGDNLTLTEIASGRPAICPDDGAIVLHPESKNEITWNANPSHDSWVKGSYVSVFIDRDPGIDRTYLAERVSWTVGSGNTQLLRKEVLLEAGQTYSLSFIAKLDAGAFRPGDVVRVTGGVAGSAQTSMSVLNKDLGKRRKLQFTFQTAGGQPNIPQTGIDYYPIVAVTATTIVLALGASIVAGSLTGAQLIFTATGIRYLAIGNTASDNLGGVTITVASPTLVSNGVISGSKVKISKPPLQPCFLELYAENVATIEWGSIQIEQKSFATAQVVQKETIEARAATALYFNRSPLVGRSNFGIFVDIKYWAGDGNIFKTNGVELKILAGQLIANVAGVVLSSGVNLPARSKVFVQVAPNKGVVSLFLDGVLTTQAVLTGFLGGEGIVELTSEGVREYLSISIVQGLLLAGDITVGMRAKAEVKELFESEVFIATASLQSKIPELVLPPTTIPAISEPPISVVVGSDSALGTVTVQDASAFGNGLLVTVESEGLFILQANVTAIVGNTLTLDVPVTIVVPGYTLRQGDPVPGKATIRFPFDPIDVQEIVGINPLAKALTLATSSLSFTQGRAIIQDNFDRFIAEVIVLSVDSASRRVTVDSVVNVLNGYKISQPSSELIIDPDNYLVAFTQPSAGVKFKTLAQNGIEVENTNAEPISITPIVKIIL